MKTFFKFADGSYKEFEKMTSKEKKEVATKFNTNCAKAYARASGLIVEDGTA